MKKRLLFVMYMMLLVLVAHGQMMNPVRMTSQLKMLPNGEAEIVFSGTIQDGWHVYAAGQTGGGPIAASFTIDKIDGAELVGRLKNVGKVISQYDKMFDMEVRYMEHQAQFVQRVRFTKPQYTIEGYLEYGACNDEMCLPPTEVTFKEQGTVTLPKQEEVKKTVTPTIAETPDVKPNDTLSAVKQNVAECNDSTQVAERTDSMDVRWAPVVMPSSTLTESNSLLYVLLMGFVGGLLAVLMPCIWPIIPMTVSFFLKRAKSDRSKGLRDALIYGLSIIVIYLAMGLLVTALFGSDTLNALSTNAVFNVLLFMLLVVFALSFFGWFEIHLPGSWADAVDSKASATTGYLSIFLMAFTLVLVSFSCTAPIIGLLLVEAATSGNWLSPTLGMLGFAIALALPFTLFALFPSWLKQAPKSGGWMNILKVALGFIELAFALKFLSVADLAYGWHLLDREVFLSLWIVIFALLGAYLCGWLKFQSDEQGKAMPVVCIMGGLVSLAFAVYMIPGLWGAPCKAVSAFAPPMSTQDFNLNTKTVEARFTDYDAGMDAARREGKPVLVDFTGFGCVNCRKMEAAVWTDARVGDLLTRDYVLISLYVDDKTPLATPIEVVDDHGQQKMLRTVGAKWSYLQSHKFGSNAQPFYVVLDADGHALTPSRGYNEDVPAFVEYLNQGITQWRQKQN